MGWNSDYCTDCASADGFQNDKFIRHIGNYLNTSSTRGAGRLEVWRETGSFDTHTHIHTQRARE